MSAYRWALAHQALAAVRVAERQLIDQPTPARIRLLAAALDQAARAVRALDQTTRDRCTLHPRSPHDPAPAPGEGSCLYCNMQRRRALNAGDLLEPPPAGGGT